MKKFLFKKNSLILGRLYPNEAALYRSVYGALCLGMMEEDSKELLAVCLLIPDYESAFTMCIRALRLAPESDLPDEEVMKFIDYVIAQARMLRVVAITSGLDATAENERAERLLLESGFEQAEAKHYRFRISLEELLESELLKVLVKYESKLPEAGFVSNKKNPKIKEFSAKSLKNGCFFDARNFDPDLTVFARDEDEEIIGLARVTPVPDGSIYIADFFVEAPEKNPLAALSMLLCIIKMLGLYRTDNPMLRISMGRKFLPESFSKTLPEDKDVAGINELEYEI